MSGSIEKLHALLGGWPSADARLLEALAAVTPRTSVQIDGRVLERLQLPCTRRTKHAPADELPAILCRPQGKGPFPVVLYCHAHGDNYLIGKQELLDGRPALEEGPYADAQVRRGMVVRMWKPPICVALCWLFWSGNWYR